MQPARAFIVEDNPLILENLRATLEEIGDVKVVGSAVDEETAVKWMQARAAECDVMIVDIVLKTGTGLGVLQAALDGAWLAQRVVLTNYSTPEMRRRCQDLGASRVFDKSNELEELIAYCACVRQGQGQGQR